MGRGKRCKEAARTIHWLHRLIMPQNVKIQRMLVIDHLPDIELRPILPAHHIPEQRPARASHIMHELRRIESDSTGAPREVAALGGRLILGNEIAIAAEVILLRQSLHNA